MTYHLPERGVVALESALDRHPGNIRLREKLLELYISLKMLEQAASQCIALSGLYVRAGNFEEADRCLLQARNLNPQAAVTSRMQELRKMQQAQQRANAPQIQVVTAAATQTAPEARAMLAGSLAEISIFDIVQVLENNHLTGILVIQKGDVSGKVYFTEGEIVNAGLSELSGIDAFKILMHDTSQSFFTFDKSPVPFARQIESSSNTSLILDLLREYDEEHRDDEGEE
jgi:Domain of unknown function (DUF4388)